MARPSSDSRGASVGIAARTRRDVAGAASPDAIYATPTPNNRPISTVAPMAAAPQKPERASAGRSSGAPPSHAASAPSDTSSSSVTPGIATPRDAMGTRLNNASGTAAPTENEAIEDSAASTGRARFHR